MGSEMCIRDRYIEYISAGIGGWGVSDYVVRKNFIYDIFGVNVISQEPPKTLADVPVQLTFEGNFIRNQWIREAGIMVSHYSGVKIVHNFIDYSHNFGIAISDCEDVEIGDNIILNAVGVGISLTDSRLINIHHNTLVRNVFEDELPSGEKGLGIYISEERCDPYILEGEPFVSSNILIADNLIDGWPVSYTHLTLPTN